MVEAEAIARPYAKAVFALARGDGQHKWLDFLKIAAELVNDPSVAKRLSLVSFSTDLIIWLDEILQKQREEGLRQEEKNFLNLLDENDRLAFLPQIVKQFEELLYKQDNICLVNVQSAHSLSASESENLAKTMERKIGRPVQLRSSVNESLLAGVIIEYEGQVIDQTLKGRLATFARTLD